MSGRHEDVMGVFEGRRPMNHLIYWDDDIGQTMVRERAPADDFADRFRWTKLVDWVKGFRK